MSVRGPSLERRRPSQPVHQTRVNSSRLPRRSRPADREARLRYCRYVDRLFFDTNQWNYLVDHQAHDPGFLQGLRDQLKNSVRVHAIEVVGSLPLLQEIIRTDLSNPAKYSAMRDLAFDTVQHRWLKPINQRQIAEAGASGVQDASNRYLSRDARRRVQAMAVKQRTIKLVTDRTREEITQFKEEQDRLKPLALQALAEHGGDKVRTVRDWYASIDVDDWVRDVVHESVRPQLAGSAAPSSRELVPSVWLFTAFKLARLARNLGEGRAIKTGDYFDADHVGCGAYFDVLVTDDKEMRETCAMLNDPPFRVEPFSELIRRLTGAD